MLDEGEISSPVYALASLRWFRPKTGYASTGWRARDRGGSPLLDAGVHVVDLLLWLLGPVSWIAAHGDGASTITGLLGFKSGKTASLAISFAGNLFRDELTLELVATRGGCRLEIRDHNHAEIVRLDRRSAQEHRPCPRAR